MDNFIKKQKIILWLLAPSLFLSLSQNAFGQEMTREVQNHKDRYSIIREITESKWMVSNFHDGEGVFSLIDDSSPTTPQIYLSQFTGSDSLRINDFVIFRDTVYFCGVIWYENNHEMSFWGFFPLAGFPNVMVKYTGTGLNTITKIQVFSVDETTDDLHVVMIGKEDGKGVVFDMIRSSAWTFDAHYSNIYDDTCSFSDIELTDNYIVIAGATDMMSPFSQREARLLSIKKPVTLHTSIFTNGGYVNKFSCYSSNILLANCENDYYSVALSRIRGLYEVSAFYNGHNYFATVELGDELKYMSLTDVAYSKDYMVLDILFQNNLLSSMGSWIAHLNTVNLYSSPYPVPTYVYGNDMLNSLVNLEYLKGGFVASGYESNIKNLRVYRYLNYISEDCLSRDVVSSKRIELDPKTEEILLEEKTQTNSLFEWENYKKFVPVNLICGE